jgi:polyisoprenoid-binding protein YceI
MIRRQMRSSDAVKLAVLILFAPVRTYGATFAITPGVENKVVFASRATLENFQGKTNQVSGSITFDSLAIGDSVSTRIEVDLSSLDTGIPLRNKHMRENHLETAKYPKAVFKGGRVLETSGLTLDPGQSVRLRLAGAFEIHGVTRSLDVPVEVERMKDGAVSVSSHFDVTLADYKIARPAFIMLKLEPTQHVTVHLVGKPVP